MTGYTLPRLSACKSCSSLTNPDRRTGGECCLSAEELRGTTRHDALLAAELALESSLLRRGRPGRPR